LKLQEHFTVLKCQNITFVSNRLWPNTPIILVGNKTDIRSDLIRGDISKLVTTEQGKQFASEANAAMYCECSCKHSSGITNLFETAIVVSYYWKIKKAHSKKALLKIRLVGDRGVGKTSLVKQFELKTGFNVLRERLSRRMDPNCCSSFIEIEGEEYSLILFDGLSDAEMKSDDRFSFIGKDVDVVLIIFSIVDPKSLEKANKIWIPHVKCCWPNTPIILHPNNTCRK